MPAPTRSASSRAVAIALGSGTPQTEESRAFLQQRLGLYARWVFTLSGGFYLLNAGLSATTNPAFVFYPSSLAHLAATLVPGGIWWVARRRVLPPAALAWLDTGGLLATCLLLSMMGGAMAWLHVEAALSPDEPLLIGQLGVSSVIFARTILLPSTAIRTFWLSVLALLPQNIVSGFIFVALGASGHLMPGFESSTGILAVANWLNHLGWGALAVTLSTVGSQVIFGLRHEVDTIKRLGQYTLEERIGAGGMGVVYRARHAMLRRPTAIKLLPPELMGEATIRRFEREVQLTARLSHPSTVAIFDYGRTPDGIFYYAMELLDGLNLDELVARDGAEPPGRVIHILHQVSGALTEAHEHGLIHRDIKPGNIILTERGGIPDVAKVVDFGLVKAIDDRGAADTVLVTGQHVVTGTPAYIAPEAIKGDLHVDARSDLYALGAVGYFLLTAEPVFRGETVVEILAHHLHTDPEPPSVRRGHAIPDDLEALIMQCLAKDPAGRPPSARALHTRLTDCARRTPWSLDRAAALWDAWRAGRDKGAAPASDQHQLPTLAVDLGAR